MSSLTGEYDLFRNQSRINEIVDDRNAVSAVKRDRQCQRRKILPLRPLSMAQIQKEIEEAVAHSSTKSTDKENKNDSRLNTIQENNELKLQDSFDLNFQALSLHTPAKSSKNNDLVTPAPQSDHRFVTPNNKIPPKIQCSVKLQPGMRTPLANLYPSRKEVPISRNSKWTPSVKSSFTKIKVNNVEYIILNELGKGGSSEVFHCFNCETKIHCGIKVVSLENQTSTSGFINEVNLLKTLQNCNRIIQMFDYEIKEQEKTLLVVLELGSSDFSKILKESAQNSSHMPLYMLLYYWMEMLYAVKQIHSKGIIHTDLKPANFLKVGCYLKLIDFGIATSIQDDMTSVAKAVPEGSFNYISPEALNNETSTNEKSPSFGKPKYKISCKSDVWSLGCILYQLVYQRTPFQHITQMWQKLAHIVDPNHTIEYPEAKWVPQRIIETIKKCLCKNVKLRPSIDELISEYEHMFASL